LIGIKKTGHPKAPRLPAAGVMAAPPVPPDDDLIESVTERRAAWPDQSMRNSLPKLAMSSTCRTCALQ
jgi:hypothetical protein